MSSSTIILNSTNRTSSTSSRYEFLFPSTVKFGKGDKIALQSLSMYNSIFNVEAQRANNRLQIVWNADTQTTHTFTIPDGFYSLTDLNYALQNFCILNDLYMIDTNGDYVYFCEILANSVLYSAEIDLKVLPTSAQATTLGYTIPAGGFWSHPTTAKSVQIIIPTGRFGLLVGLPSGTYPDTILSTNSEHVSTNEPQISPVNSILLGCNLISSNYSNPAHLFYSIPLTVGFGSMINHSSSSPIANDIAPGSYSRLTIDMYDQQYNNLRIHDGEIVLVLKIIKE